VYKLTIKQIRGQKEIVIIDPKESYTIIFDNLNYLSMFQEIQLLLPKVNLKFIQNNEISRINNKVSPFENIDLCTKIIIVNQNIDVYYIHNLINHLITKHNTHVNQICLTCITCATDQLIQLSEQYNNLHIYTTKIVKT